MSPRERQQRSSLARSVAIAGAVASALVAVVLYSAAVRGPELRRAVAGARVVASASRCVLHQCWNALADLDKRGF